VDLRKWRTPRAWRAAEEIAPRVAYAVARRLYSDSKIRRGGMSDVFLEYRF